MTGLGLKLPHGPHRRPMGGFAAFPSPETSSEARATMARCPRRVQRDSLGAAHRRSLARSARPPTVARAPHSHDRAQPPQPPESDPGPSRVAPLLSALENRTPFRLAA